MLLLSGLVLIAVVCFALLLNCAQREVNWISFGASLTGFVLSFSIVALLPYDICQALQRVSGQEPLVDEVVTESSWKLLYWATFTQCWLLTPVLIEYEAAGDFTTIGRLRASLKRNAAWYGVYLIVGAFILLWFSIGGNPQGGFFPYLISAANAWGLMVAAVLIGHGLVAVPKYLWRCAHPADQLKKLYCAAVPIDEARLGTQFELQDVINEARVEVASRSVRLWDPKLERAFSALQQTLEDSELLHCELTNGTSNRMNAGHDCGLPRGVNNRVSRQQPTGGSLDAARLDCLVQLHRDLKQASSESRRAACRWDELVARCILLEDTEEGLLPSAAELAVFWQGTCLRSLCRATCLRGCWRWLVHLWMKALRPKVLAMCSGICGWLSVLVAFDQLTVLFDRPLTWKKRTLSAVLYEHGFVSIEVLCSVPLCYMLYTAYWSIFRLKIAGWYGLYANQNTDTISLLWCASLLARLVPPLCYHFLLFMGVEGTAFQALMDQMKSVPVLGTSFNEVFSMLVLFLCVCNILNVYSRLVQFFGFDTLEFEWGPSAPSDTSELLAEGRRLVERERRRRSEERSLLELHERTGTRSNDEPGVCGRAVPLKLHISRLIEDGTLPNDWNAHSV